MEKRAWDEYEAAKLIELRGRLDELEPGEQDAAVAALSEVLQKYVLECGAARSFAEAKRSEVRVRQHLAMMEYALTDGRAGIKTVSEPILRTAKLYQRDKKAFWSLLMEANRRMGLPQREMPLAWAIGAEKATVAWDRYETAAIVDMFYQLKGADSSDWDEMMQSFSDRLCIYQEGKRGCSAEILAARDMEHVGDILFLVRMILEGATSEALGAPPLLEDVIVMMERQPWEYEALLKQARQRIPGWQHA